MNSRLSAVQATFYRAVDPEYRATALTGSRTAARYSRQEQPTLYLSSSLDGVRAALAAHLTNRAQNLEVISLNVTADRLLDLRDEHARRHHGIDLADAMAPWQDVVAAGGTPSSWTVRDKLEAAGVRGIIDPSRNGPGLWHLVLFAWNKPGEATVLPS